MMSGMPSCVINDSFLVNTIVPLTGMAEAFEYRISQVQGARRRIDVRQAP